jgi:hypothetical protein
VERRPVGLGGHPGAAPVGVDEVRAGGCLDRRAPLRLRHPGHQQGAPQVGLADGAHAATGVGDGGTQPRRQTPAQERCLGLQVGDRAQAPLQDVGDHVVDVAAPVDRDGGVDRRPGWRTDPQRPDGGHPGTGRRLWCTTTNARDRRWCPCGTVTSTRPPSSGTA